MIREEEKRVMEKMKTEIKRISILALVLALLCPLLFTTPVRAASGFKTVYTNTGFDVSKRKVNGAVFSSVYDSYTSSSVLRVTKNGSSRLISNYHNGGKVISDGKTVYYCTSGKSLYKMNISTGKEEYIAWLGGSDINNIELSGKYKNDIYYVMNVPEGKLRRINIKTGKIRNVSVSGNAVTHAEMTGKYIVLSDGTGAGHSYLGIWNAASRKFKTISKKFPAWKTGSKYIYYAEEKSHKQNSPDRTVTVKRYSLSTGAKKTLVKSVKVKYIMEITSKYIKYSDWNGKIKRKKW